MQQIRLRVQRRNERVPCAFGRTAREVGRPPPRGLSQSRRLTPARQIGFHIIWVRQLISSPAHARAAWRTGWSRSAAFVTRRAASGSDVAAAADLDSSYRDSARRMFGRCGGMRPADDPAVGPR